MTGATTQGANLLKLTIHTHSPLAQPLEAIWLSLGKYPYQGHITMWTGGAGNGIFQLVDDHSTSRAKAAPMANIP